MLTLPPQPLRPEFASFGAALATSGALTTLLLAWLGVPLLPVLAAVAAAGLVVVVVARPEGLARPYDLWTRASRGYARLLRRWVLHVVYRVLVTAVGRAGTTMALRRPAPGNGAARWQPRGAAAQGRVTPVRPGWVRAYVTWALDDGRLAALALLPFLVLLRALDGAADEVDPTAPAVAENVYTLY